MNCIFLRRGYGTSGDGVSGGTTPSEYAVTLTGTFHSSYGYVTINGTKYSAAQTVEVEEGTVAEVYVGGANQFVTSDCDIKLNGTTVLEGAGTYNHEITSNCTINMDYKSSYQYSDATITTE